MPNNSQGENSFIDKEKVQSFSGNVEDVAENLEVIETNIEMADEAVMFDWLGPAREVFNDMSECIRKRIHLTSITWKLCSVITSATVADRTDLDEAAAEAAQYEG